MLVLLDPSLLRCKVDRFDGADPSWNASRKYGCFSTNRDWNDSEYFLDIYQVLEFPLFYMFNKGYTHLTIAQLRVLSHSFLF